MNWNEKPVTLASIIQRIFFHCFNASQKHFWAVLKVCNLYRVSVQLSSHQINQFKISSDKKYHVVQEWQSIRQSKCAITTPHTQKQQQQQQEREKTNVQFRVSSTHIWTCSSGNVAIRHTIWPDGSWRSVMPPGLPTLNVLFLPP